MRSPMIFDDVPSAERDKAAATLSRVRLHEVRDPADPAFAAGYDMLASFFLDSGELEDRAALAGFVRDRRLDYGGGIDATYHFVTAWDGDTLVGVRDCYVDIDRSRDVCVVALSHSYVAPASRRSGLAAVLRALPLTLAREGTLERVGRVLPTLAIAEMEPADPDNPDTVVRLLAYGRSGFSVLDPRRVPYSQPEFRDLPDAPYTGLALLGVVRALGLPGDAVPADLAEAFPHLFHLCHRRYLPAAKVDPSEHHALATLRASGEPVRLLPLPDSVATLDRLAPLVRGAVLPLYPPGLRGPRPGYGDPADELSRILSKSVATG